MNITGSLTKSYFRCWLTAYLAANCNVALVALGLEVPPAGTPIAARRQILMDYLGTGMRT